jgi:hypothetical protein
MRIPQLVVKRFSRHDVHPNSYLGGIIALLFDEINS